MRVVLVAVVAALCVCGSVAQANLISDPGFEGTGAGPWSLDMNIAYTYNIDDTSEAYSGSQSLSVSWSGISGWLLAEAHQEFDVTGGDPWYLRAYIKITTQLDDPCFAYLETKFYDAGWGEVGGLMSEKQNGVTDWKLLENSSTIPLDAAHARARLVTFNEGGDSSGGALYWDDISTDAIPEPATFAMLGIALVGMLAARRRARS